MVGYPFGGQTYYLEHHRGLTHALIGLGLESVILASLVALGAAFLKRRGPPPSFRGLWLAAAIGLLSHLALDSLNTYGVRPFLPFSDSRYYGDMAFIVDPWLWLLFGFGACLGAPRPDPSAPPPSPDLPPLDTQPSQLEALLESADQSLAQSGLGVDPNRKAALWEGAARLGWGAAFFLGAAVLLVSDRAPSLVAWIWITLFGSLLAARHFGLVRPATRQHFARVGILAACVYLGVLCVFQRRADSLAREAIQARVGTQVELSTTHPAPAVPWRFNAVVATPRVVYLASVDLFGEVEIDPGFLPRRLEHPLLADLRDTDQYRAWRSFARIPFVAELPPDAAGRPRLLLGDARYKAEPKEAWCNLAVSVPPGEQGAEPR